MLSSAAARLTAMAAPCCGRPGLGARLDRELEGVEEAARVPVGGLDEVLEGALLELDLPVAVASLGVA